MPLTSLRELLIEGLQDLHSAEDHLAQALPTLAKGAGAAELRVALERHAVVTEQQSERLGLILGGLDAEPTRKKWKGMAGLIAEAKAVLTSDAHPAVLDLALIGAVLRIQHYEIVGYECARLYARRLGLKEAATLLARAIEEEEEAEERLTLIARSVIVFEAEKAVPAKAATKKPRAKKAPGKKSR